MPTNINPQSELPLHDFYYINSKLFFFHSHFSLIGLREDSTLELPIKVSLRIPTVSPESAW